MMMAVRLRGVGHGGMREEAWKSGLPRLKEKNLEISVVSYTATMGVGCDGFRPKVLLELPKETRRGIVKFFELIEQCGRWLQQACTTMFFLIRKNVKSERPRRASAHSDEMGGSGCVRLRCRDGRYGIVLVETLLVGAMEVRNALSGKRCSKWKYFIIETAKWTREVLDLATCANRHRTRGNTFGRQEGLSVGPQALGLTVGPLDNDSEQRHKLTPPIALLPTLIWWWEWAQ